jgi:hypothetical protein
LETAGRVPRWRSGLIFDFTAEYRLNLRKRIKRPFTAQIVAFVALLASRVENT